MQKNEILEQAIDAAKRGRLDEFLAANPDINANKLLRKLLRQTGKIDHNGVGMRDRFRENIIAALRDRIK